MSSSYSSKGGGDKTGKSKGGKSRPTNKTADVTEGGERRKHKWKPFTRKKTELIDIDDNITVVPDDPTPHPRALSATWSLDSDDEDNCSDASLNSINIHQSRLKERHRSGSRGPPQISESGSDERQERSRNRKRSRKKHDARRPARIIIEAPQCTTTMCGIFSPLRRHDSRGSRQSPVEMELGCAPKCYREETTPYSTASTATDYGRFHGDSKQFTPTDAGCPGPSFCFEGKTVRIAENTDFIEYYVEDQQAPKKTLVSFNPEVTEFEPGILRNWDNRDEYYGEQIKKGKKGALHKVLKSLSTNKKQSKGQGGKKPQSPAAANPTILKKKTMAAHSATLKSPAGNKGTRSGKFIAKQSPRWGAYNVTVDEEDPENIQILIQLKGSTDRQDVKI